MDFYYMPEPPNMNPMPYMEEPFVLKLRKMVGKKIHVATKCGTKCEGVLKNIYPDHILLVDNNGMKRHIRFESMCCFGY